MKSYRTSKRYNDQMKIDKKRNSDQQILHKELKFQQHESAQMRMDESGFSERVGKSCSSSGISWFVKRHERPPVAIATKYILWIVYWLDEKHKTQ